MEILCSLCGKPLEVRKTTKGGYWTFCRDCDSRSFISKPAGMALVEAQAKALSESSEEEAFEALAEQEAAEAAPANPGNPGPSSDAAIVGELKVLGKRVGALEKKVPGEEPTSEGSDEDEEDPKDIITCGNCGTRFNQRVKGITPAGLFSKAGLFCPGCNTRLKTTEELPENSESDSFVDWNA